MSQVNNNGSSAASTTALQLAHAVSADKAPVQDQRMVAAGLTAAEYAAANPGANTQSIKDQVVQQLETQGANPKDVTQFVSDMVDAGAKHDAQGVQGLIDGVLTKDGGGTAPANIDQINQLVSSDPAFAGPHQSNGGQVNGPG